MMPPVLLVERSVPLPTVISSGWCLVFLLVHLPVAELGFWVL